MEVEKMGRGTDGGLVLLGTAILLYIFFLVFDFLFGKTMGIILTVIIGIFGVPYFILAPQNMWFTFIKEGTAKFIVKGDKFDKALIQWKGHTFDKDWNVIPDGKKIKGKVYKEPRHPLGGFRYYGLWPIWDIHTYKFRWTGVTEDGRLQHKEEWLDFILLKDDVYWVKVAAAEEKNLLPLDVELFLTIRIINPYKARFRVQNWLETVINRVQPLLRQYIAENTYEELPKKEQKAGEEMWKQLEEAGLVGKKGEFIKRYGVEVRAIEIRQINPPETYRATTLKKLTARYEKDAKVVAASAEAARVKRVYGEIEKFGDLGKLIRTLEAAEKSPLAASLTVQAIPGLAEVLRGVFGKPVPEEISKEEIRTIREQLEKIAKDLESLKKPKREVS